MFRYRSRTSEFGGTKSLETNKAKNPNPSTKIPVNHALGIGGSRPSAYRMRKSVSDAGLRVQGFSFRIRTARV